MKEVASLDFVGILVTEVQCSSIQFQNLVKNPASIFSHVRGKVLKKQSENC